MVHHQTIAIGIMEHLVIGAMIIEATWVAINIGEVIKMRHTRGEGSTMANILMVIWGGPTSTLQGSPSPGYRYQGDPPYQNEDIQGDRAYYSPKPQRVRCNRPPQDQYGGPIHNSYQPLQDIGDQQYDGSFLEKGWVEPTQGIRNLEKEEEELDEGYSKKRRRED